MWRVLVIAVLLALAVGIVPAGAQGEIHPAVEFVPVGSPMDFDWYIYCAANCEDVLDWMTVEQLYRRWDELGDAMCWWESVTPYQAWLAAVCGG